MKHSPATAILLVLFMICMASVLVGHAWFVHSLWADIAVQHETWYKNQNALDVAFDSGVRIVAHQFDYAYKMLKADKKPVGFDISDVMAEAGFGGQGSVMISIPKPPREGVGEPAPDSIRGNGPQLYGPPNNLLLHLLYKKNETLIGTVRCLISKKNITRNDKTEVVFSVSHVTFSTDV